MSENTNQQKAITLEAMRAAAPLIATKAEVEAVKKQVEDIETGSVTYATTEEVLALFQEPAQAADQTSE